MKYGQGGHFCQVVTKVKFQVTSGYYVSYTIDRSLKVSKSKDVTTIEVNTFTLLSSEK